MNNLHPLSATFVLATLTLFISGCMPLRPVTDPQMDKKAFLISNEARSLNRHITASKGKGWVTLETPGKKERYRTAWAAVHPDKIRVSFLLSGNPVETVVSDGKKISFFSHTGKHDLYISESDDTDLEDYIGVPMKMSELISILLGHLALNDFDDAYFLPPDSSLASIITRQKEKGRSSQQLDFDSAQRIIRIQSMDNFGKLLYEIHVLDYKPLETGPIPAKLWIKDTENRIMTLEITDFEPDPLIKDTMFRLTE